MKIVLIDIQGLIANGTRSLSTRLKENKHSVKLIFENSNTYRMIWNKNYIYRYKQSVLDEVIEICKDADLVGFSVMTNFFDRAKQLTIEIKNRLQIPVVWGGIHPTICWRECLDYADIVCVGEAEKSLVELVSKMDSGIYYFDTKGFIFIKEKAIINNASDLDLAKVDEIPVQDYGPKDHYIINEGSVVGLTNENFPKFARYQLEYDTSRGCPYKCSYCCNDAFLKLYPNKKFLRIRNLLDVIDELEQILKKYPDFKNIFFTDDSFMSRSISEFEKFALEYKKRIKIPFSCITTPSSCSDEKINILFDAGLEYINFGFQTVNENVQRQYNRYMTGEKVKQVAVSLTKYYRTNKVKGIHYDIMLESPFETDYERLNTIRFLLNLPIKFTIGFFSLTFYPGTSLTNRAIKEGIIKNNKECIYRKTAKGPKLNIINLLFFLTQLAAQKKIPRWIVKFLSSKFIFSILNRDFLNSIFYRIGQYRYKRRYYNLEAGNYV